MTSEIMESTNNTDEECLTKHSSLFDLDEYSETVDEPKPDIVELTFQDFDLRTKENIFKRLNSTETPEKADSHGYQNITSVIPNVNETSPEQDTDTDGSVTQNGTFFPETKYTAIQEDEHIDKISGMSLMADSNDFIICNYEKRDIRLIDSRFKAIAHHRSIFQPWDIAVIDPTLFIVSFPFVRMLQYFKVRHKKELSPWYPLTSGNEYYGIAYERGHVIATCLYDSTGSETPCVHVMNMKGILQTVISKDSDGNQLFVEPKCIAVNSKTHIFYVLDEGNKSIVTFTRDGVILSILRKVCDAPTGLALDIVGGTVMVSDSSSRSILLMDEYLKVYKVIRARYDSTWTPFSLGYCAGLGRLLVTMKPYPAIRVFEI